MSYFQTFSTIPYQFGNSEKEVAFPDLSSYVDLIDRVKDSLGFYQEFFIMEGDRPDQLSQRLYGTHNYYWLFFLMNDHIREQGWPLTERALKARMKKEFRYTTLTTKESLTGKLKVGQTIVGSGSGGTGKIVKRRLDFGQLIVETDDTFISNEVIVSGDGSVTLSGQSDEFNSVIHYVDGEGNQRDTSPFETPSALLTPVTHIEFFRSENEKLKKIKVPKGDVVFELVSSFTEEMINA